MAVVVKIYPRKARPDPITGMTAFDSTIGVGETGTGKSDSKS